MCCGYSEEFRQVVSCAGGSVSKLIFYITDTDDQLHICSEKWIQSILKQEHEYQIYMTSISCIINSKCCFQVVKVWDFDTGRQVFEFGGGRDLSVITCMTFDSKGRRFSTWCSLRKCSHKIYLLHRTTACSCACRLITGGRDGCLKIWNFNNGQCLKTLKKGTYWKLPLLPQNKFEIIFNPVIMKKRFESLL